MGIRAAIATWVAVGLAACTAPTGPAPSPAPVEQGLADGDSGEPVSAAPLKRKKRRRARRSRKRVESVPALESVAEPAPPIAESNRCVTGSVRALGEIVVPVKNATVSFFQNEGLLGETRTDVNGKFAWCVGPSLGGERFEITVRVAKPPFRTISQSRDWEVGTQEEFDFAMVAESL